MSMPHLSRGWLFCIAGWLVWGVSDVCRAQTTAPAIQVSTRLVSVDVVVQDAGGRIVSGLSARDFAVKEDGREQRIAGFTDQTGAAATAPRTVGATKPYQFSNAPEDLRSGAITLILFDLLNTPTAEQPFARQELIRFFAAMPAGSRCGLFALTSRVRVVQNVTANKNELIAAVGRISAQPANLVKGESDRETAADQQVREQTAQGRSPAPQGSNAPLREEVDTFRQRASDTQEALAELTQASAGYPGRKNLIWMAGSFPVGIGPSLQSDAVRSLPRTVDLPGIGDDTVALAGSGIAIYPVSTRGMTSTSAGADVSGEAEADPSGQNGLRLIEGQVSRQFDLQVRMEHLASLTGGRAFYNTNDLAGALQHSVEEGDHSYRLDYSPQNKKWDGAFRHIAVSVRGHSYHLAYRQGYFATAEVHPEAPGAPDLSATVRQDELPRSGILLRANVQKAPAAGGVLTVDVLIDPASVTFAAGTDGMRHAKLLLLLTAASPGAGATPAEKKAVLNIGLEPADYQAVMARGLPVRQTMAGVGAGAVLRLGVRDLETGLTGTLKLQ